MIEHKWAPLSAALAGVTLPSPEENATDDEDKDVVNQALDSLNQYWNTVNNVSSTMIDCHSEPIPYNDKEETHRILTKAGVKELKANETCKEIRGNLEYLSKHSVVRHNQHQLQTTVSLAQRTPRNQPKCMIS